MLSKMSFWRSCCGNFWGGAPSEVHSHRTTTSKSSASTASWDEDAVEEVEPPNKSDFQPHTDASADILAKKWITHVQRRAAKIWERDQVLDLLRTIAQ